MDKLKVDSAGLKNRLNEMGVYDFPRSRVLGEVYLMLSLRCNLSCKVCAWWGIKGPCRNADFLKRYAPTLRLNELKRFIDEIADFNPSRPITFSGGEPLLYGLWYPLAKYIRKKGMRVSLTTNGLLLSRNYHKVVNSVNEINLSLGGPASILRIIRDNPPEHFDQILKGLERINKYKKKNNNEPTLRILYTISDLSYDHMNELTEFMENKGIRIDQYYFQHLMFIDNRTLGLQRKLYLKEFGIANLDLWGGFTYKPEGFNFARFKKEIIKIKEKENTKINPDLYPEELLPYYKNNRGALHYARYCSAPWHQINVMPNGDIYVCHDYFIGNLKSERFPDIWNGEKAMKLRKYVSRKMFPGCKGCFYYYCEREK